MSNLILREEKGSPLTHNELDQNLINLLLPAGVITSFGGINIPEGWLKCDGSLISRTEYTRLFNAIGELYGSGDGTTTFQLPDLRGEFIRGFDDGRGIDVDRELGTSQGDTIRNITGSIFGSRLAYSTWGGSGSLRWGSYVNQHRPRDATSASVPREINFDASRIVPTSNENRPRNISLNYIIKY